MEDRLFSLPEYFPVYPSKERENLEKVRKISLTTHIWIGCQDINVEVVAKLDKKYFYYNFRICCGKRGSRGISHIGDKGGELEITTATTVWHSSFSLEVQFFPFYFIFTNQYLCGWVAGCVILGAEIFFL